MSKPFVCDVVSAAPSVTVDAGKINLIGAVEQSNGDFQIDDGHNVTIGGSASPGVSVVGQNVSLSAHGVGKSLTASGLDGASVHVTTDGAIIVVDVPSVGNAISVGDGGNVFVAAGGSGNAVISGSQVVATGSVIFENASLDYTSTMETYSNAATLDPAASVYNQLTNVDVPGLLNSSRLKINPAAGGTTIDSLFTNDSNPNPDGRVIEIQNVGAVDDVVLPNQSAAGTDGGKFFWGGDFTLPAGKGATLIFDRSVGAGSWLIVSA